MRLRHSAEQADHKERRKPNKDLCSNVSVHTVSVHKVSVSYITKTITSSSLLYDCLLPFQQGFATSSSRHVRVARAYGAGMQPDVIATDMETACTPTDTPMT